MAGMGAFAGRAARYGLAGMANTAVGLAVIYALDLGLHVAPQIANAAGYGAGALVGYGLNKVFVFRSGAAVRATGPRYLVVVLAAFALNQLVLTLALAALTHGPFHAPNGRHALAQLIAMATYTAFAFLACQFWVFGATPAPAWPEILES